MTCWNPTAAQAAIAVLSSGTVDIGGATPSWRLLDAEETRAYNLAKSQLWIDHQTGPFQLCTLKARVVLQYAAASAAATRSSTRGRSPARS